ncbi:MAG: GmrSD restriction endonuclease domain-containing protein [Sulfitobacter sp.]
MEARSKSVEDWFAMIRGAQVTLPRFQRFEAWSTTQIEGVLENILRTPSLPVGALLVLEVGEKELFHSRPLSGAPEPKSLPQLNLLDGQQRMTALWKSLNNLYEEFLIFVSLEDENEPDVQIVKRYTSKAGNPMPAWAHDPVATFQRKLLPISILCPGSDGEKHMDGWCDNAQTDKAADRAINKLRHRLAGYMIPFLSLPVTTGQETALDVFINMNTSASPLKDFDIVVAQLERTARGSLHDMIDDLHEKVPAAKEFGKIEDTVLAVGALLNGEAPLKRTYLDKEFGGKLAAVWDDVVTGMQRSVEFLRDEGILNEKLLPTEVIVYLSAALWAGVPEDGTDQEGWARSIIRKAVWRASFTDRYLKTASTRAFADFKRLRELIASPQHSKLPELFDEVLNPLPDVSELVRGGWPSRKDRLGRAIVVVSLSAGGYDFADEKKATAKNVPKREYHHVYPKALLVNDYSDQMVNSALNCALISWATNRKIGAKTPKDYIEARAKDAKATEEQVRYRLESHLIPYDELISGDYSAFLEAKAELVHAKMVKLVNGQVG